MRYFSCFAHFISLYKISFRACVLLFVTLLFILNGSSTRGISTDTDAPLQQNGTIEPTLFDPNGWYQGFGYPGIDGTVLVTEINGDDFYVAGWFRHAGGVAARNLAKFDGETGQWSAVGPGASLVEVHDILISGNQIYLAGRVEVANYSHGVGVWDGSQWAAIGGEFDGLVHAIALHQGQLYATGAFTSIDGIPARGIARWNGSQWEALGSGLFSPFGNGVGNVLLSVDDTLYVGGAFYGVGSVTAHSLGAWRNGQWQAVADVGGIVFSLAWDGASLYVGGQIQTPGIEYARGIVRVYQGQINPLAFGLNSGARVNSIHLEAGNVYIAGSAIFHGENSDKSRTKLTNVGFFDGVRWQPLGEGIGEKRNSYQASVGLIGRWQGKLLVSGMFENSGATTLTGVGIWDGSRWQRPPLSLGLPGGVNGGIAGIAVYGSDLYTVGDFTLAGGVDVPGLARWDGQVWHSVADGTLGGLLDARLVAVNSTGLYVAGRFTESPDYLWNIAHWNGSVWQLIGNELRGDVFSMNLDGPSLTVSGYFRPFGPQDIYIAGEWNGSQWTYYPIGKFMYTPETEAIFVNGTLYYCGRYDTEDGYDPRNALGRWSDNHWEMILVHLTEPVCRMRSHENTLYIWAYVKEMGQYAPVVVWTGWLTVEGADWEKLAAYGQNSGTPFIWSESGDFFFFANGSLSQVQRDSALDLSSSGIQWIPAGAALAYGIPDTGGPEGKPSQANLATYRDLLMFAKGQSIFLWKPQSGDLSLALTGPKDVLISQTVQINGTVTMGEGQNAPAVNAKLISLQNVESLQNDSIDACNGNNISFECQWPSLALNKSETFRFSLTPRYLDTIFVEMAARWTGRDTRNDNDQASIGVNVYDTFQVTPQGGRFLFWFSPYKFVDLALPASAISTTVDLRIEGGALPSPGQGLAIIQPVFGLRPNELHRGNDLDFALPISTTIRYTEVDSQRVVESTVALMRYDSQSEQWIPSHLDCVDAPASAPSPDRNRVYAPVCRSGTFALVGEAKPLLFLPQLERAGE